MRFAVGLFCAIGREETNLQIQIRKRLPLASGTVHAIPKECQLFLLWLERSQHMLKDHSICSTQLRPSYHFVGVGGNQRVQLAIAHKLFGWQLARRLEMEVHTCHDQSVLLRHTTGSQRNPLTSYAARSR